MVKTERYTQVVGQYILARKNGLQIVCLLSVEKKVYLSLKKKTLKTKVIRSFRTYAITSYNQKDIVCISKDINFLFKQLEKGAYHK